MRLLAQLADDWGWEPEPDGGKSVWCVLTGAVDPWGSTDQWMSDDQL